MTTPKVTIVTPSYNQGQYIKATLDSVLSQNYDNIEYFVYDALSNDQTQNILKQYEGKFSVFVEKDKGQSDAINKGWQRASGEILCWLNSDDTFEPGAIAQVVDYFKTHPDVDIIYSSGRYIDENANFIGMYPTQNFDLAVLLKNCFICQPCLFLRKRVVEKIGYLRNDLHYCMDYEYWLRAAQSGMKFVYLKDLCWANSRIHKETKTNQRLKVHQEIVKMQEEKFGYADPEWVWGLIHAQIEKEKNIFFALQLIFRTFLFFVVHQPLRFKIWMHFLFLKIKNR